MGRWRASLVVALAACGSKAPPPGDPEPDIGDYVFAGDPIAAFGGLEEQLSTARRVVIDTQVESIGDFKAELTGHLDVEREFKVSIQVDGEVGGAPVAVTWSSHDLLDDSLSDVQSPVWADGLLIGLARMGVTRNFERLIGGIDPETGNGDIRSWVEIDRIEWKGGEPRTQTLTFEIAVIGIPAGEGELVLDTRGLPLRRDQILRFDQIELRVVEHYDRFDVIP